MLVTIARSQEPEHQHGAEGCKAFELMILRDFADSKAAFSFARECCQLPGLYRITVQTRRGGEIVRQLQVTRRKVPDGFADAGGVAKAWVEDAA